MIADLKPHKLAREIPEMLRDEYVGLVTDIKAHGLRLPIVLFDGQILDGRHRARACVELGIVPKVETFAGTEAEAWSFVQSINAHRRHLTIDQKQTIIAAELKRDPKQSDRQAAKKANASPTTAGKVRAKLEATGELSTVDSSVGADGKVRLRKPKTTAKVRPETKAAPAEDWHDANAAIRKVLADRYRRYSATTQHKAARHLRELIELTYISKGQRPKLLEYNGAKVIYCTFCGKCQNELLKIIAGPSVFICNECIDLCNKIIREQAPSTPTPDATGEAKAPIDPDIDVTKRVIQ